MRRRGEEDYRVQKGTLDTEKWRAESLAQNDSELSNFQARAAEESGAIQNSREAVRQGFRGYRKFLNLLESANAGVESSKDEHGLFLDAQENHREAVSKLGQFRRLFIPAVFRIIPLWVWIVISAALCFGLHPILTRFSIQSLTREQAIGIGVGVFVLAAGAYFLGRKQAGSLALGVASALNKAGKALDLASQKAQERHARESERIRSESESRIRDLENEWEQALSEAAQARERMPEVIDEKWRRVSRKNQESFERAIASLEAEHNAVLKQEHDLSQKKINDLESAKTEKSAELKRKFDEEWVQLTKDWQSRTEPVVQAIESTNATTRASYPEWSNFIPEQWKPPASFLSFLKFGRLEVDVKKYAGAVPQDKRLGFPAGEIIGLPLTLSFPEQGSVVFETTNEGKEAVIRSDQ